METPHFYPYAGNGKTHHNPIANTHSSNYQLPSDSKTLTSKKRKTLQRKLYWELRLVN